MRLNQEQHTILQSVFISAGLSLAAFDERWTDDEYYFSYIMEPSIRFTIHRSIQGKLFGDVCCNPYTYQETMYMGCETFDDCLELASISGKTKCIYPEKRNVIFYAKTKCA